MPSENFESMVTDCFDGVLPPADGEALAAEIERDEAAAHLFAQALALEALLIAAQREPPNAAKLLAAMRSTGVLARGPVALRASSQWHGRFAWRVAAAAAVIVLVGLAWLGLRGRTPGPSSADAPNQVVAGSVLANGVPAVRIPNGSRVTVAGESRAVIRLADGSEAALHPGAVAVLRGPVGAVRQVVELERGAGTFKVTADPKQFSVATPLGSVMVMGTEFSVELRPVEREGGDRMERKAAVLLAVAVLAGSVRVEFDSKTWTLSAGESRVFGAEAGTQEANGGTHERVTLTGMGKALGDASGKLDPTQANATLTVTDDGGKETVYDVCGWAGVIVAKQGDGKKVEVTGVVYEKDGKKRIIGKSVDVKIIVVEEKPEKKTPQK
ncbi:MAG: FecR family protein [Planctomycetota bacterium]|nr:FecR family protein [Planctomycetota bacterium]